MKTLFSKSKKVLNFSEKIRAMEWLKANIERLKGKPSTVAAEMCSKEIQLGVSESTLKMINSELGLGLFTRSKTVKNVGSWHDVAACLARAIHELNEKLGYESEESENLTLIIQRYHSKIS